MKTAISVPDELFRAGEDAAQKLCMSRSQLYATALSEFLARRDGQSITERLNAVYATESSKLDPVIDRLQIASLEPEQW